MSHLSSGGVGTLNQHSQKTARIIILRLQVKPLDWYLFFYVIAALCEHRGLCFGLFLCDIPDLYCMGSPKKNLRPLNLK